MTGDTVGGRPGADSVLAWSAAEPLSCPPALEPRRERRPTAARSGRGQRQRPEPSPWTRSEEGISLLRRG